MMRFDALRSTIAGAMLTTGFLVISCQSARATTFTLAVTGMVTSSNVNGASLGAGTYTLDQLAAAATAVGPVSSNGQSGISLWALLGGNAAGASNVLTPTPAGDNAKNAILRSYVLATDVNGAQSIISLGEIDPFFGATGSVPDFIAFSGTDGQPELVFPGTNASGRNVMDLASLQVLSAPALVAGPGGTSTAVALTGNVAHPGNYNLSSLQALPAAQQTIGGDTYTGVPLWNFISPNNGSSPTQYVLAGATDGYEVLFSLAELDPSRGVLPGLVAYNDTQGQFPSNGFARIVVPGDNHQGRYVSNLTSLELVSIPEPGTTLLFAAPLFALWVVRSRRAR